MEENNISLDELAGGTLPTNSFDMTSGVITTETPNTPKKVVPVAGAAFNPDSVTPVDINAIFPKVEKPSAIESSPLFADLDAAVEREKQNITDRQNQLFDAMKKEVEAAEEAYEVGLLDASIKGASAEFVTDTDAVEDEDIDMEIPLDIRDGNITVRPATEDEDISMEIPLDINARHITVDDKKDDNITVRHATEEDNILGYMDNDKLFDDEEDTTPTDTAPSDEEVLNIVKEQVRSRLNVSPRRAGVDLSKFTIANKAISLHKVMKMAITGHQNIADWVLPAANRSISMTGLSGPEILKLDASNSNRNRMNTFKDMYGILYKHVVDANKPEFEVWLKQIRFTDLQHIYFAAYMATFSGSSFTNYSCPHCGNVFIHDIEFNDLVNYKDDNTKAKIHSLIKRDSTSVDPDTYEATLVQISEKYAFAIRTPSIWNTVIEIATLSDKFLETHADLIDLIAYIDTIYLIDYDTAELVPVDVKPDPNDMGKSVARRVKSMYDIISTLSSDEYSTLRSAIGTIDENSDDITYKLPSCSCPKCNKEIPESGMTPEQLLFTRHQLAAIANMSN